jgi:pimeloyl-ACP methyl ester carboxylesterase
MMKLQGVVTRLPKRVALAALNGMLLLACATAPEDVDSDENQLTEAPSGVRSNQQDCRKFAPLKAVLSAPEQADSLVCAKMTVPERRSPRSKRNVEISWVVAKATTEAKAGDRPAPLVVINGGPATPSTDLLSLVIPGGPFEGVRRDRDVIFVAERGVEYATPQLSCAELDELVPSMFGDDGIVRPIEDDLKIAAVAACSKRHAAAGIDLSAYNVREMAEDVHDAVRAAGYEKFSVWGVSFGTGLAQQIAKLFPQDVASIILDSPTVFWDEVDEEHRLMGNPSLDVARSIAAAFKTLFDECRADTTGCNARHPDLENTMRAMLQDFDERPLDLPVEHDGRTFTMKVTGEIVYQQLQNGFSEKLIPHLPRIIDGLRARDEEAVALIGKQILSSLVPPPDVYSGLVRSVYCSGWAFADPRPGLESGDDLVKRYLAGYLTLDYRMCSSAWRVPRLQKTWPAFNEPLESNSLPALLFPGKFDPNTHPFKAEQIKKHLPRSFVHVAQDHGHVSAVNECGGKMIAAFLRNPSKDPDSTCFDAMTPKFQ